MTTARQQQREARADEALRQEQIRRGLRQPHANSDAADAVAEACGLLNDHDLPNVYALTKALYDLLTVARLSLPEGDARVVQAELAVKRIAPHFGANI